MNKMIRFFMKYFTAFFGSLWLFTFGALFRRNRDLLTSIAFHFGYGGKQEKKINPLIPEIELKEFLTESLPIRLLESDYSCGNVSLEELVIMNRLVKTRAPKKILEMGTFDGRTALNLAANCPDGALVYTLDLPQSQLHSTSLELEPKEKSFVEKETSGGRYRGKPEEKKIVQLYGDTASFDFSPYYNTIDLVFIDASHAYAYVMNDSRIALKLLRNAKGVILWHDYAEWNGVTKALNELYQTHPVFRGARHIRGTHLAHLILE